MIETKRLKIYVASQKVLEKCGFKRNGIIGEEGPRFVRQVKKFA